MRPINIHFKQIKQDFTGLKLAPHKETPKWVRTTGTVLALIGSAIAVIPAAWAAAPVVGALTVGHCIGIAGWLGKGITKLFGK